MTYSTFGQMIHTGREVMLHCQTDCQEPGNGCLPQRYRIFHLKQGFGVIRIQDRSQLFTAPSVVCVHERENVEFIEARDLQYDVLFFNPTVFNEMTSLEEIDRRAGRLHEDFWFFRPFKDRNGQYIGVSRANLFLSKRLEQLMAFIRDELVLQRDGFWPCRSRSYFIELILLVCMVYDQDEACEKMTLTGMTDEIRQIINYLHVNYPEKITIDQLVKAFHTNKTTLNEKFKEVAGITVLEYLGKLRMQIACSLLKNTQLTVNEIMERVGSRDDAHFLRAFKQYSHCTPSVYRAQAAGR